MLSVVWGVHGMPTGPRLPMPRAETVLRKSLDRNMLCKSFCAKEYFTCYKKNGCFKKKNKARADLCIALYRECRKICTEEFDSMGIKEWVDTYVWKLEDYIF